MKTVSNQELTIRVSEHGAELSSIVANATGKEYLWQADPAFWKRHSPVLFPIVGAYGKPSIGTREPCIRCRSTALHGIWILR